MGSLYGVDNTGLITTAAGIRLPSSGGTQTTLNYNGTETIVFQMTGSVTPTFNFTVTFSRTGNLVVMKWIDFFKARNVSNSQLFTGTSVPPRFLPTYSNSPVWVVMIIDGSSPTSFTQGVISFGGSGQIVIAPSSLGNFSNTYCGILGSTISYYVN